MNWKVFGWYRTEHSVTWYQSSFEFYVDAKATFDELNAFPGKTYSDIYICPDNISFANWMDRRKARKKYVKIRKANL